MLLIFPLLFSTYRYGFDVSGNSRRGATRNVNNTTPFGWERFSTKGYDWEGKFFAVDLICSDLYTQCHVLLNRFYMYISMF